MMLGRGGPTPLPEQQSPYREPKHVWLYAAPQFPSSETLSWALTSGDSSRRAYASMAARRDIDVRVIMMLLGSGSQPKDLKLLLIEIEGENQNRSS